MVPVVYTLVELISNVLTKKSVIEEYVEHDKTTCEMIRFLISYYAIFQRMRVIVAMLHP